MGLQLRGLVGLLLCRENHSANQEAGKMTSEDEENLQGKKAGAGWQVAGGGVGGFREVMRAEL